MKTINSLIEKELVRRLSLSATLLAFLLFAYSFYFIHNAVGRAEATIERQTVSLIQAAATSNDALLLQKELSRFTETWEATEPFPVRIQIWKDGKFIASSGSPRAFRIGFVDFSKNLTLPSAEKLEVKSQISILNEILLFLFSILILESVLAVVYIFLIRYMRKSVQEISTPLKQTIDSLHSLAQGLPQSAHTTQIDEPNSTITEVNDLIISSRSLQREIVRQEKTLSEINFDRGRLQMAEYVAHNIRGALTTLKFTIDAMKNVSRDDRETIENSIGTISSVGRDLLSNRRDGGLISCENTSNGSSDENLIPLVEAVIRQKRIEYRKNPLLSLEFITSELESINCNVNPTQFKSILENLIDNAVQATEGAGQVIVKILKYSETASISVHDNGHGIKCELIPLLLTAPKSVGKLGGSGIGLSHALEYIRKWNGDVSIKSNDSSLASWTEVTLSLPIAGSLIKEKYSLRLWEGMELVIVDDEDCISQTWRAKLKHLADRISIISFKSPVAFKKWLDRVGHDYEKRFYLIDYEFGRDKINGLDLIEGYGLATESRLVTGKSNDADVVRRARQLGVKQIPKEEIHSLKIDFVDHLESRIRSTGCLT